MAHPLDRRLAALEARARPDQGLRVVVVQDDFRWSLEERKAAREIFSCELPKHRGLIFILRWLAAGHGAK
jgi:hypothetical protein